MMFTLEQPSLTLFQNDAAGAASPPSLGDFEDWWRFWMARI